MGYFFIKSMLYLEEVFVFLLHAVAKQWAAGEWLDSQDKQEAPLGSVLHMYRAVALPFCD